MAIVVSRNKISEADLALVQEEYDNYIKVVVDIENGVLAAGGEWHADCEKVLIDGGSLQANLWGGGIDLETGEVDYISLINTRPNLNSSQEVADPKIREKMHVVITNIFKDHVKK